MADILPAGTNLPAQNEYEECLYSFTPSLEVGESVISVNIIDRRPNDGISVNGSTFSGQYINSFSIGKGAIKVRLRNTGRLMSYDSWESLPPPQEADIYEWNAPSSLTTVYTYTVEMKYAVTPPVEPGLPPPIPVEKTMVKLYNQSVRGSYNIWANQLKNYVKGSR